MASGRVPLTPLPWRARPTTVGLPIRFRFRFSFRFGFRVGLGLGFGHGGPAALLFAMHAPPAVAARAAGAPVAIHDPGRSCGLLLGEGLRCVGFEVGPDLGRVDLGLEAGSG